MGTEPGETYEAAKIPESGQTRSPTVLPVKRRREWQEQYAKEQKEPAAGEQQDGSPDEMEDVNDDQDTLQDSEPDQPVAVNSRQVNQPYPPEIVVAETHIIDTRPLLQEVVPGLMVHPGSLGKPQAATHVQDMEKLLANIHVKQAIPEHTSMSEYDSVDLSMDIMVGGRGRRRGTRRGPMDEMRQLVRILVKIIPQSFPYLATTEDGGGNRISEEQIKFYLDKTLGAAPRPEWGLPQGWGYYLATLFRWATGRDFSQEEARQCAKRLPGRSWEAVEPVLDRFKLRPHTWKLPLQQVDEPVDGLYVLAEDNQARKHPAEPEDYQRPRKMRVSMPNLSRLDGLPELDTWKLVHHLLKVAEGKQGSSPVEMRDNLVTYKREVKEMVDRCCADVQQPSNAMQQMPATQLQTGAGGQFSLHGLQALQLQHLQQQPMMGSQAPQAQSVPYTTVAIANPVPPSSTPIDGGVSNVVHRPRPTAFTPVVKQAVLSSKAMGGVVGDKQAGSDHEATVSAEGDDQDKGEIVDQPHADIQKPPGNVQVAQTQQLHSNMATLGTHEAEQVPTPTIFFNTFSTQPGSQLLLQSQGQVDGQAMSAHIQQQQAQHHHHSAFGGFQTFAAGMPYCSAAMGMKAGSVNGVAVPVQLPNGQIVYGQAADMTQFQMQCSQGQSQMPMMAPQPIVLALQPQIGYAAQQVGGMMTGHTAQGMPQIMAMPVGGIQHSGMQHVQGM